MLTDRVLLRLHIEAVWGVKLPSIEQQDIELAADSARPAWGLCVAELANERIQIWRPDVATSERPALLARVREALALPPTVSAEPGIAREVALHQAAAPRIDVQTTRLLARPLTVEDRALVEALQPGSAVYYFQAERHPLIGVVVDGRLLSLAHSSRRTSEACELGIDTLPEARRKGYALAATALWTETVAREGLVPLYSAFSDNTASLRLAAAASYRIFAHAATCAKR